MRSQKKGDNPRSLQILPQTLLSSQQGWQEYSCERWRHLEDCSVYKKQKPTSQSSITDFSGCVAPKKVEEDLVIKTLKFFISAILRYGKMRVRWWWDSSSVKL